MGEEKRRENYVRKGSSKATKRQEKQISEKKPHSGTCRRRRVSHPGPIIFFTWSSIFRVAEA